MTWRPKINPGKFSPKRRVSLVDLTRLLAKIEETESGCWEWTGYRDANGYGKCSIDGEKHGVHRVFYTIFKRSIPEEHEIDHRCKNRSCCNPAHIRALPMKKNRSLTKRAKEIDEAELPSF